MALSIWIADVTNSTLNMTSSTFSFQDALSITPRDQYGYQYGYQYGSQYGYYPYLFQNGCLQDDRTQNCTAFCQNKSKVFGSLDTLHNCMVYSTVADLYARNNLSNTSLAKHYNIQKSELNSSLYQNITSTIQTCLVDYCTITLAGTGCKEGLATSDPEYSPSNITSSFYYYNDSSSHESYTSFDFCAYVPQSFNADIGGIGVYVSYWIQTGLALLSFFLVVWWNWGIYYICLGALLLSRGYSKARKTAQRIRNSSRDKHLPSLTGGLAEFQKTQCFFMLSINIAALVNTNRGGFQPKNMQQLYNTYILLKSISISGYLPVTFTLFTLHLVDVVSWYLLVLSIVTVIVSTATLFVIGNFNPGQDDLDYLSQQALSGGPDTCGTKNPLIYCYSPVGGSQSNNSTDPASGAYSMLAFCLVVLILLVAHQYHAFTDPSIGEPKLWLSKILSAFFRKYHRNLRRIQTGLALISFGLNIYVVYMNAYSNENGYDYYSPSYLGDSEAPGFVLFSSCWTLLFLLYLFSTSATAYTRTDRPIGRFFNQKLAFVVDSLSAVFWFASFVALTSFYQLLGPCDEEAVVCGPLLTSVFVGLCTWITFVATTAMAARHILRTHNEVSEKKNQERQCWILQRFHYHRLKRQSSGGISSWKRLTGRVLTKHPWIVVPYTRLQRDVLPSMKVHTRRAYQDVRIHASTLDWQSMTTFAAAFSIYLIFFGFYINWFKIFIQDLKWFAYNGVDVHSWSFGQIVAIAVWASPLCEYFHLELRGMTRGFEHRLWGYKVVRIKQQDAEQGIVSNPASSNLSPSPTAPLDGQETSMYGEAGIVECPARHSEHFDQASGEYSDFRDVEPTISLVPSEETEERGTSGEWQIPETVILTSESISPF